MRNWRATTTALAAVSALALVTACSSDNEKGSGGGDTGGAGGATGQNGGEELSGELRGIGASSQQAAQEAWMAGFNALHPGVSVSYSPDGSGAGREQFVAGGSDFGGSDAYLTDEEGELSGALDRCGEGNLVEIPMYISPVAVIFNLPDVGTLNLKPATIARIFDQKISDWNDEAIAADNPDVELPDLPITPVNRSDESGTTENFVEYLSIAAPDDWPHEVSGDWPVSGGEAAKGTAGVTGVVESTEGAIGYADASQAGELGTVAVGVGDAFVEYSPEAASAVVQASTRVEGRGSYDFAYDIARDTTESGVYPIVLVSYGLACAGGTDDTSRLVEAYLSYVISEEGQRAASDNAGAAPISDELRQRLQPAVDAIHQS